MPIGKVQDTLPRRHDDVREQRRCRPPDVVIARSALVRARRPASLREARDERPDHVAGIGVAWRSALAGWMSIVVAPTTPPTRCDPQMPRHHLRIDNWLRCGAAIGHLRAAHRFDPETFWRRRRQSPAGERHMMVGPGTGKVDITIAINPCEVLLAASSPGMTAAMTNVIFISIPLWATRVALEQPSCLRQRAASCRLRASITACRHHRHGPSLRAHHDEALRSRGILLEHLRNPAIDLFLDFRWLGRRMDCLHAGAAPYQPIAGGVLEIDREGGRTRKGKRAAWRRQQRLKLGPMARKRSGATAARPITSERWNSWKGAHASRFRACSTSDWLTTISAAGLW